MTVIDVRTAADGDAPRIDELRRRAAAEAVGRRGGAEHLRWDTHERPDGTLTLVGTCDGVVLAYAVVQQDGTLARLHELFTEPRARGVGLGHALLGEATARAAAWGCDGLDSVALPGDRSTKNFFEAHGLRARLLTVHRSVAPDDR